MSEWIEWMGGKSPVKAGAKISIKWRLIPGETMNVTDTTGSPELLHWGHHGDAGDIVAYRIEE